MTDTTDTTDTTDSLYTLADAAHCDGDLDTALSYYKQALHRDPRHYLSLRWAADIYLEKSDWQAAIDMFKTAYTVCHTDAHMLNDFALCYYENADYEQAVVYYKHAMQHDPELAVVHRNFGIALYELYRLNKPLAVENAHWWRHNFPDNPQAQVMASAVLGENIAQQNPQYVQGIFDDFAEDFEQKLHDLNYQAPTYVYQQLQDYIQNPPVYHILDAGCGTGLVGDKIRPLTTLLSGIDLSEQMLKIARDRHIYDHLHRSDLMAFLQDKQQVYNAIVAGDVLCYFGDLEPVISLFYTALQQSGVLIFTVEYDPQQPFLLTPSGRYSHDRTTTENILYAHGFKAVHISYEVLRTEHDDNVDGLVVVACK